MAIQPIPYTDLKMQLVADIKVGDRFRKDYGNLDDLKKSILTYGLLEPIIIDRDLNLVAGGRRLRCHQDMGLGRIAAVYLDEVDPIMAREIELEENVQRKDLELNEVVDLTTEIHKLKMARFAGQTRPATESPLSVVAGIQTEAGLEGRERAVRQVPMWTQADTAALLNQSPSTTSRNLALGEIYEVMPEMRSEEDASDVLRKVQRRLEELEREYEFRQLKKAGKIGAEDGLILFGDCLAHLETMDDASIDCIIMDPPYGVIQPGGLGRYENMHFDDDPVAAMAHLRMVAKELARIAKPNAHIYCFFGIKLWIEVKGIFDSFNFDVDPIPLIWVKSTGSVIDWTYRYANFYEPFWFISNRTRSLAYKRVTGNVFNYDSVPNVDRTNIAEKPLALIKELIMLSTTSNELVLDPYAGSGVVAVAAKETGRRFCVIEKDQDQWNGINVRVANAEAPQKKPAFSFN